MLNYPYRGVSTSLGDLASREEVGRSESGKV